MPRAARGKSALQFHVFSRSVQRYFENESNWDAVYPYLCEEPIVSRRLVEHFLTDYSRTHVCVYPLHPGGGLFNVYHEWHAALSGCHKRHLDPFNRANPEAPNNGFITVGYGEKKLSVSVASLLCYQWLHKHRVLEYIQANLDDIKDDMSHMAHIGRKRAKKRQRQQQQQHAHKGPEQQERQQQQVALYEPPERDRAAVALDVSHPLCHDIWRETTRDCQQPPPKVRRRSRPSVVDVCILGDQDAPTTNDLFTTTAPSTTTSVNN